MRSQLNLNGRNHERATWPVLRGSMIEIPYRESFPTFHVKVQHILHAACLIYDGYSKNAKNLFERNGAGVLSVTGIVSG